MKRTIYTICCNILLIHVLCSCTQNVEIWNGSSVKDIPTYRMQLQAVRQGYESTTRSDLQWEDGSKVYLCFHELEGDIIGVATYDEEAEMWNIQPSKALAPTEINEAVCQAIHFVNPTNLTSNRAALSTESVIYIDTVASYMLYDDLLIVRAVLMPKTGRIRFKGVEGQTFGVSGLSYYNEYNFSSDRFSVRETKLVGSIGENGMSSFFHAFFTNAEERTIVFDYTENAGFKSTFGEAVLRAGTSGSITVPTYENQSYWTLVNKKNLEEIVLPEISDVNVASVRSATAVLRATISSVGNGTISDAGFLYSTSVDPAKENGVLVSCGTNTKMELRIKDLTPVTTYYVKAYVVNERGQVWSDIAQFTTISMEEDISSVDKDDFGEDDDLNDNISSGGDISKDDFGEDDDLNDNISSGGNINKDGFGEDDDLNDNISSGGNINKDGFGEDDDLNDKISSGGNINKDGFGEDDDLNDKISSGGTISKGGFGEDDDLNDSTSV